MIEDTLIGRRLVQVVRPAWHWPGDPDDLGVGPVDFAGQILTLKTWEGEVTT